MGKLRLSNLNVNVFKDSEEKKFIRRLVAELEDLVESRLKVTTHVTGAYTVVSDDDIIMGDTDGGSFTVTLPVGIDGELYKIANTGTSSNTLTIAPYSSELLIGVNSNLTLADGERQILAYDSTEGWY